jgi:hypothetical protein
VAPADVQKVECPFCLLDDPSPQAAEARAWLVRLSGRQMKHRCTFTVPALLAGLWVLSAMLDALEHYSVADLRRAAALCLPAGFV